MHGFYLTDITKKEHYHGESDSERLNDDTQTCLKLQYSHMESLLGEHVHTGAYEPPEGRRRSVRLRVRCVRRSSLAMLDLIWSGQLQGISIG